MVEVKSGQNYQLTEGDVITEEFLNELDDADIEQVRLIRVDIHGAVYTSLLKTKAVDILEVKRLQKANHYSKTALKLAVQFLKGVEYGVVYDPYDDFKHDENFDLFDDKGELVKLGCEIAMKDRIAAIYMASTINPQLWRQSFANAYEEYRLRASSYDVAANAKAALYIPTEEERLRHERYEQECVEFIDTQLYERKKALEARGDNIIVLSPTKHNDLTDFIY